MNINYIYEREAFYDWLQFNYLSPTAQSLWNALFTICNAKGWPGGFMKIPDEMLRSYMHVSHDALLDARAKLKSLGVIDFIKGERRTSAAAYKLNFFTANDFCPEKADKPADKPADKGAGKEADKPADKGAAIPADTPKLNVEVNVNADNNRNEGILPPPKEIYDATRARTRGEQAMVDWFREIDGGEERWEALVDSRKYPYPLYRCAAEYAQRRKAQGLLSHPCHYVISLLEDWTRRGITTAEEVDENRMDYIFYGVE